MWRNSDGNITFLKSLKSLKNKNLPMQINHSEKIKDIGGQAVIEGVMMRAPTAIVIAVRKPNSEIVVKRERLTPLKERFRPSNGPFCAG